MTSFKYRVKDKSGHTINGVMDVEDQRTAVNKLQMMGYFVLDIRESRGGAGREGGSWNPFTLFNRWIINPIFAGASAYQLSIFYRQFATMIKSGITVSQAMNSLRTQGGSRRLRKIAEETCPLIQSGGQLSDAFARYPWMFPQLHIDLIRAGELGGSLESMLSRIADYLEREHSIRQKLRMSTLYPKILILAVVFIPSLPKLILEGLDAYLRVTLYNLIPVLIFLAILWGVYRVLYQIPAFRYGIDLIKLSIPKIGGTSRMLAMAKFYRIMAAMYAAGVPLSKSITRAADAAGNGYLTSRLKTAVPMVERGEPLTDSLRRTGALSGMALDMLSTGEQTGNVDAMLDKAAEYTENEAEVAVVQITVVVGVLLLLCVAAYIGFVVLGFYVGQFSRIM